MEPLQNQLDKVNAIWHTWHQGFLQERDEMKLHIDKQAARIRVLEGELEDYKQKPHESLETLLGFLEEQLQLRRTREIPSSEEFQKVQAECNEAQYRVDELELELEGIEEEYQRLLQDYRDMADKCNLWKESYEAIRVCENRQPIARWGI